ncbi:hypothetical protein OH77DRAFT_1516037 [Trametes cingulata]|nr:hypothetical protein OH77DRAFT_1516037 [Trametes cingulata]
MKVPITQYTVASDSTAPVELPGYEEKKIYTLEDERHVLKTGPWDLILWEFNVYSDLQRFVEYPMICERFVDCGSGSATGALLLHRVTCLSTLFDLQPWRSEDSKAFFITAFCAQRLIRTMRDMHERGVLHRDIHPGNVVLTRCWTKRELLSKSSHADDPVAKPVHAAFIDFEGSFMNGYHPRLARDSQFAIVNFRYASDRVVRQQGGHTAADDFVSLSYVILALRMMAHPPWCRGIVAPLGWDSWEDYECCKSIVATRARSLAEIRARAMVEPELWEFIDYAQNLQPDAKPDYLRWIEFFSGLSAGMTEVEDYVCRVL